MAQRTSAFLLCLRRFILDWIFFVIAVGCFGCVHHVHIVRRGGRPASSEWRTLISPDEQARPNDSEDGSYHPLSEEEVSLGNEDFIVPEEPLEQERFKRRLIATARSLKKKQQQLQADQDLLMSLVLVLLSFPLRDLERRR